jgi:hypothetical protein
LSATRGSATRWTAKAPALTDGPVLALALVAFLAIGFLLVQPGLHNPWFWDDLALMRHYPASELGATWHGSYDVTGVQTPGYRPLQPLLYDLRFALLGEDYPAQRLLTVATCALALTSLALALRLLGASLFVAVGAGLVELTAKDFTYAYAWVTDTFHGFQLLTFGISLAALAAAIPPREHRRLLLVLSIAAWVVTLLVKDSAVVMAPVLLLGGLLGQTLRDYDSAPEYGRAWQAVKSAAARLMSQRELRRYAVAVVGLTIADLALRRALVAGAKTSVSLHLYTAEIKRVLFLGGTGRWWLAYAAATLLVAAGMVLLPRLVRARGDRRLTRAWLFSLYGLVCVPIAAAPGLVYSRSDLVTLPLYFYAVFLCAGVFALVLAVPRRAAPALTATAAALAIVSVVASVHAGAGIQRAMGAKSVQKVAFDYDYVYGRLSAAPLPPRRRASIRRELARVGIHGRRPDGTVLGVLVCEARSGSPWVVIPEVPFFGDDLPLPTCANGRPGVAPRQGGPGPAG